MNRKVIAEVRALLNKKFEHSMPVMLCGAHGGTAITKRPLSCAKCRIDVMETLEGLAVINRLQGERMSALGRALDRLEASFGENA